MASAVLNQNFMDIKRDFYKDVYTIFKSDFINNKDHMSISGTEPSSVILSHQSSFKSLKSMSQKCQISWA